jgi:tetratricopeptide (TPR) repeat protein
MRQLGLRLGLLLALALSASTPSLRAQDSPSAEPSPAPAKSDTITCTVDISPKTLPAPLAEALHLYRTGKLDESAAAYNAVIASHGPDAVLAYTGLARVYLKQKKPNDAFDAASKAVALTPDKTPAVTAMGEVYFRQGKMRLAQESFYNPLKVCDVDARAYLGLSKMYLATSNYKLAKDAISHAYKIDPADPDIRRGYMLTLGRTELIKFLTDYLAGETNDDPRDRTDMEHELALLQYESGQHRPICRITSKLTATQTPLETLLYSPDRIRGYGLNVKVNGTVAKLRLDTGAGGIVIDKKIADKAGMKKIVEQDTRGVGDKGAAAGYVGFADSVQVGDLEFENCPVRVVDRNSVVDDDGLIGADVFRSYLVDIDFPEGKLKLTQLPPYPDEAPAEATLESRPAPGSHLHDRFVAPEMKSYTGIFRFNHSLLIPTRVNNSEPMLFLIDTGAFDDTITPEAAKQVTTISRDENIHVKGLSGEVKEVYRADKADLQFSHFKQPREHLITFALDSVSNALGTEVSGILGIRMLRLFDLRIDYRDGLVDFIYSPAAKH